MKLGGLSSELSGEAARPVREASTDVRRGNVWAAFKLTNPESDWQEFEYCIELVADESLVANIMSGKAVLAPGESRLVEKPVGFDLALEGDLLRVRVNGHREPVSFELTEQPLAISIVIPALNEEAGIAGVLQTIPVDVLREMGYQLELLVIDNGSSDRTRSIARAHGVNVIVQPVKGYGNAYKAGFANSAGDIIVTGDADGTYPFDSLPSILRRFERDKLDFINTDRLTQLRPGVMSPSHKFGNWFLTRVARILFGWPFHDSQSGMWIFRGSLLSELNIRASGMPFSQEIKLLAYMKGFRCAEVPIEYRARSGQEKLNTIRDGLGNLLHLIRLRVRS